MPLLGLVAAAPRPPSTLLPAGRTRRLVPPDHLASTSPTLILQRTGLGSERPAAASMLLATRSRAAPPGFLPATGRRRVPLSCPARRPRPSRLPLTSAAGSAGEGSSGEESTRAAAGGNLWQQLRSGAKSLWRSLSDGQQPVQPGAAGAADGGQEAGSSGSVQQGGPGRSQSLTFRSGASASSSMDEERIEGRVDVVPPAAPPTAAAAAAPGEVPAEAPSAPPIPADVLLSWDAPAPAAPGSFEPGSSGDGGEAGWAPQAGPPPPPKPWGRNTAGEPPWGQNGQP